MTTSAHPFPVSTFRLPHSPGLSTPVSRGFIFLPCILRLLSSPSPCTSGYSASCSSFQPSIGSASQWLSQRPAFSSRSLRIFPFHPVWFPIQSFRFCLFGLLFVPFRSSLIRSHSRSSGARFSSPSSPQVPSRVCPCRLLPFVRLRFRASATQSLFLPFPSSRFPLTVGTPVPIFPPFHSPVAMRLSWSWYSASLQFRFPLLKFRLTGATSSADLSHGITPVSSAVPLGFRFRFRYYGLGDTP